MDNFIVISGGPGSGKTTLIEALAERGFGRTVEAGRFITKTQVAIGGRAVHWDDQAMFAELALAHEMRNYEEAKTHKGLVFFDRSVSELPQYMRMVGRPVPPHFERAAQLYRYNRTMFIAPAWREIFANDTERKQDWAEAVSSYEHCLAAYESTGYEVVELPKTSVEERISFVLARVGGGSSDPGTPGR